MPYVERDGGKIAGLYANAQTWTAEFLPDDHPDVVAFLNPSPPPVTSVSARQFKMQLAIGGLKTAVDVWVSAQDDLTQIAYEYSGSFEKHEPMMQAGFDALGFTPEERDAFFNAASQL